MGGLGFIRYAKIFDNIAGSLLIGNGMPGIPVVAIQMVWTAEHTFYLNLNAKSLTNWECISHRFTAFHSHTSAKPLPRKGAHPNWRSRLLAKCMKGFNDDNHFNLRN